MAEPICALEAFSVGGSRQWALIRGADRTLPVLLVLPPGPGWPLIPDANALEEALHWEQEFVVVYWDPRGCGKSFDALTRHAGLSVTQYVIDTAEMIQNVRNRMGGERVFLLGFSLGATIGALTARVCSAAICAFVGVGMDIDWSKANQSAYTFLYRVARERTHKRALRDLTLIGDDPVQDTRRFMLRAKWLAEFGGFHRGRTYRELVVRQARRIITCRYYTVRNRVEAVRGMRAVADLMLPQLAALNLFESVRRLDVPVSLFQGRHDPLAPAAVSEQFLGRLEAPRGKEMIWFESSAHMPQDEEPELFRAASRAIKGRVGYGVPPSSDQSR